MYQPRYRPCTNHVTDHVPTVLPPTMYRQHTDDILTTYQPRYRPCTNHVTDHVPTTYLRHTDNIRTTLVYRPCTNHVTDHVPTTLLTTYRQHTNYVSLPTMYQPRYRPCTDHVTDDIPTTYLPLFPGHCGLLCYCGWLPLL